MIVMCNAEYRGWVRIHGLGGRRGALTRRGARQVSERSQRSAVDKLASNTRMEEHVSSSTKLMMRSESHMETHMESEAAPTAGAEVERAAEYAAAVAAVAEPELKPKLEPKPETEPAAVTKDP